MLSIRRLLGGLAVVGLLLLVVYISRANARPPLPEFYSKRTPPDAAALSVVQERIKNGGWIGRPERELRELLGQPFASHMSCSASTECGWVLRIVDDGTYFPTGVVVEILYTESGGMWDWSESGGATRTLSGEPAVHRAEIKQLYFRR